MPFSYYMWQVRNLKRCIGAQVWKEWLEIGAAIWQRKKEGFEKSDGSNVTKMQTKGPDWKMCSCWTSCVTLAWTKKKAHEHQTQRRTQPKSACFEKIYLSAKKLYSRRGFIPVQAHIMRKYNIKFIVLQSHTTHWTRRVLTRYCETTSQYRCNLQKQETRCHAA